MRIVLISAYSLESLPPPQKIEKVPTLFASSCFSPFSPARLFRFVSALCIVLFTTDSEEGDDPPPPPFLGEPPAGNHLAPPQPPDVTSGGSSGGGHVTTTRLRRRMSMRPGSAVFGGGGGGGGGTVGNMRPMRSRRPSFQGGGGGGPGGGGGGGPPQVQLLSIPQLDAIQRSLKLLDVRLQHIQSAAKEDEKTKDNIDHIRRVSSLPSVCLLLRYLSFPEKHKVGSVGTFALLKFENKLEAVNSNLSTDFVHGRTIVSPAAINAHVLQSFDCTNVLSLDRHIFHII